MQDDSARLRIMQAASLQFVKYGYAKVTTGEIAAALGISKKTLYKYFVSKEELYLCTAHMHIDEVKSRFDALIRSKTLTFIEKLTESMEVIAGKLIQVGAFMVAASPHLPRANAEILRRREQVVIGFFRKLFREGVRKGFVNKGIDEGAFVLILITVLQNLFVPQVLARLPFSPLELFKAVAKTLLEGLLSDGTRRQFDVTRISFDTNKGVYWNV